MTPPPPPRSTPSFALAVALVLAAVQAASAPAAAATLQLSGPPGAAVSLEGRDLGLLPLPRPLDLPAGVYTLTCRLPGHHDLEQTVVLAEPGSWLHVRLRPSPLLRREAVTASALFAGLGQWYRGDTWRGWFYFLGEAGGLLTAVAGEVQRVTYRDDYLNDLANYRAALDDQEIAFWRARAAAAHADMQDMEDLRDLGLMVAGGAWLLSLLDAWLLTPTVDLGPGVVPPGHHAHAADPSPAALPPRAGIHAGVTLPF